MRHKASLYFLALLVLVAVLFLSCGGKEDGADRGAALAVYFLDVGQSDCTLILAEDTVILVDTGGIEPAANAKIISLLERLEIDTIDCLILSHPHNDHIGGVGAILSRFAVSECIMPNAATDDAVFSDALSALRDEGCVVREAIRDLTVAYGGVSVLFLSPDPMGTDDINEMSAVCRVTYRNNSILLMGDAGRSTEKALLERYAEKSLTSQILKLGHHGAKTATSEEFLAAVAPIHAVASCGAGNGYGYPHVELVARVLEAGVRLHRTDTDGDIVFYGDGETFRLK